MVIDGYLSSLTALSNFSNFLMPIPTHRRSPVFSPASVAQQLACFSVFETRCQSSQIAAGSADEGGPCNLADFKSGFQFAIETLP